MRTPARRPYLPARSAPGGCLLWRGVPAPEGGWWYPSMYWGRPPPVDRHTPVKTLTSQTTFAGGKYYHKQFQKFTNMAKTVRNIMLIHITYADPQVSSKYGTDIRMILHIVTVRNKVAAR